jgi:hypothetical protein
MTNEYALLGDGKRFRRGSARFISQDSSHPEGDAETWLPAIAVPLENKATFECPDSHLAAMREWLPEVDRMLIIGWRGGEQHFLTELKRTLRAQVRTHIVVGYADEYLAVSSALQPLSLNHGFSGTEKLGFSKYLAATSGEWQVLLLEDLLR